MGIISPGGAGGFFENDYVNSKLYYNYIILRPKSIVVILCE